MLDKDFLSLITGQFLLGFSAGYGHCIAMCHPFVIHISSIFPQYKGYKLLIPNIYYNIGRTITYSFMGFITGSLGTLVLQQSEYFTYIQKAVNILAGIMLIMFAIFHYQSKFKFSLFSSIFTLVSKYIPKNPLLYGIVLGFLPCGFVSSALTQAIALLDPIKSSIIMFAFGAGTTIALIQFAIFGAYLTKYSSIFKYASIILLFTMGIYNIYLGIIY